MEAYQEVVPVPSAPPSSPPLTPPSAPPPPDCAAYDAQIDIVAATSAGARANPSPAGNNLGITVLSSDQGQARMQNGVTPGASLVRMEAGDYAMLDLGTSGDVCTIGLYQGGNKICTEINAYVCPSDSTSYTLASDCTHVGSFTGVNAAWSVNTPEGTTGRYMPWSAPHFKPSKTLPTGKPWKCTRPWLLSLDAAVGPDALASWRRRRPRRRSRCRPRPRCRRRPRQARRRRPRQARRCRRRARVRRRCRPPRILRPRRPTRRRRRPCNRRRRLAALPAAASAVAALHGGRLPAEASQGYEAEVPIHTDVQVLARFSSALRMPSR